MFTKRKAVPDRLRGLIATETKPCARIEQPANGRAATRQTTDGKCRSAVYRRRRPHGTAVKADSRGAATSSWHPNANYGLLNMLSSSFSSSLTFELSASTNFLPSRLMVI